MQSNRLLVIDDEPLTASVVGKVARMLGFDVITTDDPSDLRTRLRAWQPSAIVLDLLMPGLDGFEVLGILNEEGSTARILIVSGVDYPVIEAARNLAARYGLRIAGVLSKPFELDALSGLLRAALSDSEQVNAATLTHALVNGELYLEFQPKVDLRTLRPTSVEALLRWRHPRFGLVPPTAFLPVVEQQDLIAAMATWVISAALEQKHRWSRQGLDLDMAINLSARDFAAVDIGGVIESCCAELGMTVSGITLEITESAAAVNPRRIAAVAQRLPGIRLSLDDLGTGYSSLLQLRQLPFSEVKIDQYFVKDCTASRENMIVVRALIDLAHQLGHRVVAEGVESAETLQALTEANCDGAQGYWVSLPLSGDRLPGWVAGWTAAQGTR
jgi:EAL domain-containing protein (putative c-di-GMP-specific phosphodiesterase class I)/AmiR/NasT family two-component response regulator